MAINVIGKNRNNETRRPRVVVGTLDSREMAVKAGEKYAVTAVVPNCLLTGLYAVYRNGDSTLADITVTAEYKGSDTTGTLPAGSGSRDTTLDVAVLPSKLSVEDTALYVTLDQDITVGKVQLVAEYIDIEEFDGGRVRVPKNV